MPKVKKLKSKTRPCDTTSTSTPTTGAPSPTTITHGFVLNDARWLYAMLYESQNPKTIENRHVKLAAGWYAVSLSQAAHTSIADDIAFKKEFPHFKGAMAYTKGVVHGAVRIDRSLPQIQCAESRWSLADYKIANIVSHTLLFGPRDSVPVRGMYPSSRSHTRARPLLDTTVH